MFYKLDNKTGEWHCGNEAHFPDGEKLNKNKKVPNNPNENHKKDFVWYDEPPQVYLDWLEVLKEHINL